MSDVLDAVLDIVSATSFMFGAVLALVASIGLHRLKGTRSRMHATTKPATLGVLLCAFGAILQLSEPSDITKVMVVVVLQLVTSPIGAHMFGRSVGDK